MSVRRLPPLLLALVLGLLAAFAVACGDDGDDRKLLPKSRAAAIEEELDTIASRVERGKCVELEPAFTRLDRAIAELPRSTDRALKRRLAQGADNLREVAPDECRDNRPETETTETEPDTIPETTPETVDTEPPPTQTETTPPQTQTTPPQTQTTPPATTDPTGGQPAPETFTPPGQAKKGKG